MELTLGERITYARRLMGKKWTQQKLADELEKFLGQRASRSWIAAIENGRFKPQKTDIAAFAKVLKQPESYFSEDTQITLPYEDVSQPPAKTFYEKIFDSISDLGFTREKFAEELSKNGVDVTNEWISALEEGKIRVHSIEWDVICKVLGKPFEYFVETSSEKEKVKDREGITFGLKSKLADIKIELIPILAEASQQKFKLSIDDTEPDEHIPISVRQEDARELFAVKIKGDFLSDWIRNEEYAIISKTPCVEDGKLAVVRLGSTLDLKMDYCVFKKVYTKTDCIELVDSQGRKTRLKPQELEIIGKVKGSFRRI